MNATTKPRVYGFRISRGGEVYAYTRRPVRGRCPERYQLLAGHVWRVPGGWKHDVGCSVWPTQNDAALAVLWVICGTEEPTTAPLR